MENKEPNVSPCELAALLEHKWYLSQRMGREATLDETYASFIQEYLHAFRRDKAAEDNSAQAEAIADHRWVESERAGRDIGQAAAEEDWHAKFARMWRAERESLERNGFLRARVKIVNRHGLHTFPCVRLLTIAKQHDAELYVTGAGFKHCNFRIDGRPVVNVKSFVVNLLTLGIPVGEELEFIAYGRQAAEVLEAVRTAAANGFGDPSHKPIETEEGGDHGTRR